MFPLGLLEVSSCQQHQIIQNGRISGDAYFLANSISGISKHPYSYSVEAGIKKLLVHFPGG